MRPVWLLATAAMTLAAPALAQSANEIVVTAQGLPGLDPAKLPAASDTVDAAALRRGGTTSLLRTLDTDLSGVTLDEAQDNPYQPNLLYRGYEASPLGGNPQGLASYVDGARFNQPFGDTTNWDLIPDIAVDKVTIEGSNPVFGLNALGGALAIDLKTGRSFRGLAARRRSAASASARSPPKPVSAATAGLPISPAASSMTMAGAISRHRPSTSFTPRSAPTAHGAMSTCG